MGTHNGKVVVCSAGIFSIRSGERLTLGINHKVRLIIQKAYSYEHLIKLTSPLQPKSKSDRTSLLLSIGGKGSVGRLFR